MKAAKLHHGRHHFNGDPECGTTTHLECDSEGTNSDSTCSPTFDKLKHHKRGHHAHMVHFGRKMGRRFGHHGHHGHKMGHHAHKMGHHGPEMENHVEEIEHPVHKMGHHGRKNRHHGHKMSRQEHKMCHQERSDLGHHGSEEGKKRRNAIITNPEKFEINLSVKQFKPDEVSVKAVNNSIIVDCNHPERELKNEFISRHIMRRFEVPAGYDLEIIQSELSADGILRVIIPKIQNLSTVERVIPVVIEQAPIVEEIQEEPQVASE